ncbi:MAG: hypothetical protein QOI14_1612 [Actinomycetota bacterium]|nr:hypothetical protein [Actinomycetota bacterium]
MVTAPLAHRVHAGRSMHQFADRSCVWESRGNAGLTRADPHRMRVIMRKLARALRLRGLRRVADDAGSATAEYAIATLAAVGFAGLLVVILRSGEVRGLLTDLIRHALSFSG